MTQTIEKDKKNYWEEELMKVRNSILRFSIYQKLQVMEGVLEHLIRRNEDRLFKIIKACSRAVRVEASVPRLRLQLARRRLNSKGSAINPLRILKVQQVLVRHMVVSLHLQSFIRINLKARKTQTSQEKTKTAKVVKYHNESSYIKLIVLQVYPLWMTMNLWTIRRRSKVTAR